MHVQRPTAFFKFFEKPLYMVVNNLTSYKARISAGFREIKTYNTPYNTPYFSDNTGA